MAKYEDERPGRALLTAAAAMIGVALVVGLVVGGVALIALKDVVGGSTEVAEQESEQSLFIPKYRQTEGADDDPKIPGVETPSSSQPLEQTKEPTKPKVTLFVAPQQVSPGGRINFNGVYVDGEGASLQIQRRENGTWTDFPVTASVQGGSFETWIQTSRTGKQVFRVFDASEGRGSNTVTVTVG